MSKTNSDTLTTKILRTSLRKRNFSGTTPNGVSLGSRKMGGLESIDIYTQQGVGNLIQFAKASRDNNEQGKLLKIAYMWWRYTLGIENCPLQVQEETVFRFNMVQKTEQLHTNIQNQSGNKHTMETKTKGKG
jgi:hypothetical protein